MSIERYKGRQSITCDSCPEATEEFDDFNEMIDSVKSLGWQIKCEQGEWTHTCPACAEMPTETGLQKAKRLLG